MVTYAIQSHDACRSPPPVCFHEVSERWEGKMLNMLDSTSRWVLRFPRHSRVDMSMAPPRLTTRTPHEDVFGDTSEFFVDTLSAAFQGLGVPGFRWEAIGWSDCWCSE